MHDSRLLRHSNQTNSHAYARVWPDRVNFDHPGVPELSHLCCAGPETVPEKVSEEQMLAITKALKDHKKSKRKKEKHKKKHERDKKEKGKDSKSKSRSKKRTRKEDAHSSDKASESSD